MTPGDVLTEIKRQFDWRTPDGRPQSHIVLTRVQAEVLLRLISSGDKAIDDGMQDFLDAVAKALPE
jgi:hypothetical protein